MKLISRPCVWFLCAALLLPFSASAASPSPLLNTLKGQYEAHIVWDDHPQLITKTETMIIKTTQQNSPRRVIFGGTIIYNNSEDMTDIVAIKGSVDPLSRRIRVVELTPPGVGFVEGNYTGSLSADQKTINLIWTNVLKSRGRYAFQRVEK